LFCTFVYIGLLFRWFRICIRHDKSNIVFYNFIIKPSLVVIGFGNPGKSYEHTRHNAGFLALDHLSKTFGEGEWKDAQKFLSVSQEARIVTVPVLFLKPQTFMNRSGEAVRKVVDFYKLNQKEQVLVVVDDIDIPLGTVRLRKEGSAGTHNGLKSMVEQFGEEFPRLRIGIGSKPEGADLANWVLSRFSAEEEKELMKSIETLPEMIKNFVMNGASQK
jgi:PTH1 family peptidyl-tRNA hydrolase